MRYEQLRSATSSLTVTPGQLSPSHSCDAELEATSTEARIKIPNGVNYDVMASGRRRLSIKNIPANNAVFPFAVYMPTISSSALTQRQQPTDAGHPSMVDTRLPNNDLFSKHTSQQSLVQIASPFERTQDLSSAREN